MDEKRKKAWISVYVRKRLRSMKKHRANAKRIYEKRGLFGLVSSV